MVCTSSLNHPCDSGISLSGYSFRVARSRYDPAPHAKHSIATPSSAKPKLPHSPTARHSISQQHSRGHRSSRRCGCRSGSGCPSALLRDGHCVLALQHAILDGVVHATVLAHEGLPAGSLQLHADALDDALRTDIVGEHRGMHAPQPQRRERVVARRPRDFQTKAASPKRRTHLEHQLGGVCRKRIAEAERREADESRLGGAGGACAVIASAGGNAGQPSAPRVRRRLVACGACDRLSGHHRVQRSVRFRRRGEGAAHGRRRVLDLAPLGNDVHVGRTQRTQLQTRRRYRRRDAPTMRSYRERAGSRGHGGVCRRSGGRCGCLAAHTILSTWLRALSGAPGRSHGCFTVLATVLRRRNLALGRQHREQELTVHTAVLLHPLLAPRRFQPHAEALCDAAAALVARKEHGLDAAHAQRVKGVVAKRPRQLQPVPAAPM
mmetsp:Transcript_5741/g.20602  ORF Transcript_5741/g.20602 Transcript_5741/m.20602 type:complete len:436 (-) Transcript_5741:495-1802(-)